MNDLLPVVFISALLGGLIAGIICSVVIIAVSGSMIANAADYALEEMQDMIIDCSEDPSTGMSTFKLGDQTIYCSLRFKEKGQEKEFIINPAPGGDLSN